ncbi:hypothetical protein CFA77_07365 [Hyphomonas sp. KY3]|nr:hypothetical protein CFA77_07365 [Hyphomonas sp. KY3]
MVLISDGTSIRASNAAAQLGPEDTKGASGKSEDAEGQLTEKRIAAALISISKVAKVDIVARVAAGR